MPALGCESGRRSPAASSVLRLASVSAVSERSTVPAAISAARSDRNVDDRLLRGERDQLPLGFLEPLSSCPRRCSRKRRAKAVASYRRSRLWRMKPSAQALAIRADSCGIRAGPLDIDQPRHSHRIDFDMIEQDIDGRARIACRGRRREAGRPGCRPGIESSIPNKAKNCGSSASRRSRATRSASARDRRIPYWVW